MTAAAPFADEFAWMWWGLLVPGFVGECAMSDCVRVTDAEVITRVADSLSISEFKLFQCAYEDWYQRAVSERELEVYFVRYMFKQEAPSWVRHYARIKERELELNEGACSSVSSACGVTMLLLWASVIRCTRRIAGKEAVFAA